MKITQDQFNLWRTDPVTIAFFQAWKEEEGNVIDALIEDKGEQSGDFYRGAIWALRGITETKMRDLVYED